MSRNRKLKNKWQTAAYVRLSREDGDDKESQSIIGQKQMIEDYVSHHSNEFEIVDYYVDDGFTGTNFNRPDIQRLFKDIDNKVVNCVIVKDLSRFGRDYIDVGHYLERYFPDNDIRFISLNDNIDSFKQDYDMLLPVKNVFNQQYAVDISKKVQSRFKMKQHRGEFIGAFSSYGYLKNPNNRNKLIIDEYAAQIVRRIFDMYINGMGQLKIARILNDDGILCPSEYKKQNGLNYRNGNRINSTNYWTYSTVHRVLTNEIYCGHMVQNKTKRKMKGKPKQRPKDEWIIVHNTHEAIIDKDTWDKAQNLLKRNTRQLNFEENLSVFAGFLRCADCGRAMSKNTRGKYIYYICGSYKRYGLEVCTRHTIRHDQLEEIVLDYFNLNIKTLDNLKQLAEKQQKTNIDTSSIKNEINRNELALDKIYNLKKGIYEDYKEGLLTKEEYLRFKSDYDASEKMYRDKIDLLEKQAKENNDDVFQNEWLTKLIEQKEIDCLDRSILADFIDYIEIGEDKKITITWNCPTEINKLMNRVEDIINSSAEL